MSLDAERRALQRQVLHDPSARVKLAAVEARSGIYDLDALQGRLEDHVGRSVLFCRPCAGTGWVVERRCRECDGEKKRGPIRYLRLLVGHAVKALAEPTASIVGGDAATLVVRPHRDYRIEHVSRVDRSRPFARVDDPTARTWVALVRSPVTLLASAAADDFAASTLLDRWCTRVYGDREAQVALPERHELALRRLGATEEATDLLARWCRRFEEAQ